MHEYAGVYTHNILVQLDHGIPPILLDVALELASHLSVIVNRTQSVINLARRENESIFLGVGNQILENFFLCHILKTLYYFFSVRAVSSFNNSPTNGLLFT